MPKVTDDKATQRIAGVVAITGLQQLKAEDFVSWHGHALERCYITPQSQFEFGVRLSRGWDTDMTFSVRSNADESVDRLTDRTIDAIRMTTKDALKDIDDPSHTLDDNEYISRLRISRFEERTGAPADSDCYSYNVEYETVTHDSLVIQDERVSGYPRVAGRRLLVRDVWFRYVRNEAEDNPPENPFEEISDAMDEVITPEEAEEIVDYAEERQDMFGSPSDIVGDDDQFSPL